MTPALLDYLLRATVIWSVLLAYYFLAVRSTGFRLRRTFLLGSWLFGLLVPLLPSLTAAATLPLPRLPVLSVGAAVRVIPADLSVAPVPGWSWPDLLPYGYLLGVLFCGARTLVQGHALWGWARTGTTSRHAGYSVTRHPGVPGPFAAAGRVFLPADMADAALAHTALLHETAHLRARHHYDNFLLTLSGIFLWFHPLTWVYRRLLTVLHEYEADAAVIQRVPARTYGRQLLHSALGPARGMGLFSSPLQQRIEMLTDKKRQPSLQRLPLLLLFLLLAGLIVACSDIVDASPKIETEDIRGPELPAFDPATERFLDAYPKPLAAEDAATKETLLHAIYREIRYPAAARQAGEVGFVRVIIHFAATGAITNVTAVGMSPEEDENPKDNVVVIGYQEGDATTFVQKAAPFVTEIERTFNDMGPYAPAQRDGKPVPVALAFDFRFDLER